MHICNLFVNSEEKLYTGSLLLQPVIRRHEGSNVRMTQGRWVYLLLLIR